MISGILDICEELADTELVESFQNTTLANHSNPRWTFIPELLLKEVLKITCEDVPEEFCCFSKIADMERCLLKIDEAEVEVWDEMIRNFVLSLTN